MRKIARKGCQKFSTGKGEWLGRFLKEAPDFSTTKYATRTHTEKFVKGKGFAFLVHKGGKEHLIETLARKRGFFEPFSVKVKGKIQWFVKDYNGNVWKIDTAQVRKLFEKQKHSLVRRKKD